jgi:hypothetical protein
LKNILFALLFAPACSYERVLQVFANDGYEALNTAIELFATWTINRWGQLNACYPGCHQKCSGQPALAIHPFTCRADTNTKYNTEYMPALTRVETAIAHTDVDTPVACGWMRAMWCCRLNIARSLHIGLLCICLACIAFFLLALYRPYTRSLHRDSKAVAGLLSQLPSEVDVEGHVKSVVLGVTNTSNVGGQSAVLAAAGSQSMWGAVQPKLGGNPGAVQVAVYAYGGAGMYGGGQPGGFAAPYGYGMQQQQMPAYGYGMQQQQYMSPGGGMRGNGAW